MFGKIAEGEAGVLVTLGSFSKQARDFADSKANLRLVDGDELVRLVLKHYESLDRRHKGIIPLRRSTSPRASVRSRHEYSTDVPRPGRHTRRSGRIVRFC